MRLWVTEIYSHHVEFNCSENIDWLTDWQNDLFYTFQLLVCLCATSISAEAFVNHFSAQLVPVAPIATQFSPSPLTLVTPPVGDSSIRHVYRFHASVAPAGDLIIPYLPPNLQALSVNSFEKQQELHSLPQTVPLPRDTVYRADFIDGVQKIESAHQSFTFRHGNNVPQPIGFKTYGLPVNEGTPIFVNRPEIILAEPTYTLPIESKPVSSPSPSSVIPPQTPAIVINISHPTDIDHSIPTDSFATNPEFTLPMQSQPIAEQQPIQLPANHPVTDDHKHDQPTIQPILTLTPPLETPVESPAATVEDELPVRPLPGNSAPSTPVLAATEAPPLIRNIDNKVDVSTTGVPSTPNAIEQRLQSGDKDLYSNEYSSPDGTSVSESGQIFSTADGWENVVAKRGHYKYTSPEGQIVDVEWIADQRGFRIVN